MQDDNWKKYWILMHGETQVYTEKRLQAGILNSILAA